MQLLRVTTVLAATGLLACTKLNLAFDGRDDASGGDGQSTTASLTGLAGSTTASTTTTTTTASSGGGEPTTGPGITSTTTDASSSTGAPVCAKIGESCGECCGCGVCPQGICLPDNSQCGPCGECQEAACVPLLAGKGCVPPGPDTCSDKFWGLMDGDCYAQGPLLGTCDDQSTCDPQPCGSQGALLGDCDASCIKDPGQCEAGQPAKFDAMKLCEFDNQTKDCGTLCVPNINGDFTFIRSCHAGLCQEDQKLPCGNYRCRDDLEGCQTDCKDASDCQQSKDCNDGACVP